MDFKDVEVEDLVKTMAKLTGRNFMIDERVRGKVTIISPTPISVQEAYRVFLAVLEFRNLTIVPSGKLLKIVPNQNAIKFPTELTQGKSQLSPGDNFVTRIVQLGYVDANEMATLLKNFNSSYGQVIPYLPTNLLILADSANQINRMLEVIGQVDVPGNEQGMEFVKLTHSSAADIAKVITDIYAAQAAGAPGAGPSAAKRSAKSPVKIIPVERLNSVIVLASSSDLPDVKNLIGQLDVRGDQSGGTIHVYYLSYSDAEALASTLGGFTSGAGAKTGAPGGRPAGAAPGGTATPGTVDFEGGVKITPDKSTNSLIIVASSSDYQTIKSLIRKLDVPRRQVYVEAVIMEVSVDKIRDLGLSWHVLTPAGDDGVAFGGQALGGVNTLTLGTTSPPAFPGLFLGALSKPIDLGGVSIFGLGALLRALQSDESVNILSTPNILTSDNQDAEIIVGQNVPFITGQTATTGGNVLTSIERQDVGITLKITPQINANSYVKLKIQQETSSVQLAAPAGLNVNQQGLITRKRSAKTTVVVKDRQTVVIGGLMSDEIDESQSKIPILGDLPIFGWLFKSSTNTKRKTNLVIFLTPYVIASREDMDLYTNKREEFFHQFREDNYIKPLSEEYTFRRTFGQRVGESEVVDERLIGEDYMQPEASSTVTETTTRFPARQPAKAEPAPSGAEKNGVKKNETLATPPVPKPVKPLPGEEEDLTLPERAPANGAPALAPVTPAPETQTQAPAPVPEAPLAVTEPVNPMAPL